MVHWFSYLHDATQLVAAVAFHNHKKGTDGEYMIGRVVAIRIGGLKVKERIGNSSLFIREFRRNLYFYLLSGVSSRNPQKEANCSPSLDIGIGENNNECFGHSISSKSDSSGTGEMLEDAVSWG